MAGLGLKVIGGVPEEGRVVPVAPGCRLLLGRYGPEHGIAVQLSCAGVSRRHAVVWWDDAGLQVEDLHSINGTFLNDCRIEAGPALLGPCDTIQLADVVLRVVWLGQIDPAWLRRNESAVLRIARELLAGGLEDVRDHGPAFGVLHDALLDAGCDEEMVLDHCRGVCPHAEECTLLPLLAGGGAATHAPGALPKCAAKG